jgi:Protein of unknown function (DUF3800)
MGYQERDTLFLFLDESGNLDFSPSGTRYWSLTAFCTFHPSKGKEAFLDLLYSLADQGVAQEHFHATEDKQAVRDQVFERIGALRDGHEIHCVVAEKSKANPSLYNKTIERKGKTVQIKDESPFYGTVCKTLLSFVLGCPRFTHAKKVVVVLSSLFTKDKNQTIRKILSVQLANRARIPYEICFHDNKSDLNCQIADYCGWAIARKWDKKDARSYDLIKHKIENEFDLFSRGVRNYY